MDAAEFHHDTTEAASSTTTALGTGEALVVIEDFWMDCGLSHHELNPIQTERVGQAYGLALAQINRTTWRSSRDGFKRRGWL